MAALTVLLLTSGLALVLAEFALPTRGVLATTGAAAVIAGIVLAVFGAIGGILGALILAAPVIAGLGALALLALRLALAADGGPAAARRGSSATSASCAGRSIRSARWPSTASCGAPGGHGQRPTSRRPARATPVVVERVTGSRCRCAEPRSGRLSHDRRAGRSRRPGRRLVAALAACVDPDPARVRARGGVPARPPDRSEGPGPRSC